MNQTDFILIGAFVFAGLMAIVDLTNTFGQIASVIPQTEVNQNVTALTYELEGYGFDHFRFNQTSNVIAAHATSGNAIMEDTAYETLAYYGFNMTVFHPYKNGTYIIGHYQ